MSQHEDWCEGETDGDYLCGACVTEAIFHERKRAANVARTPELWGPLIEAGDVHLGCAVARAIEHVGHAAPPGDTSK